MEHYTNTNILNEPGQTDTLNYWKLQGMEHYTITHLLNELGQTDRHINYWKLQGTEHYTITLQTDNNSD